MIVAKLKLHNELHGINKIRYLQIDHVREVLKLTYHRVLVGWGIEILYYRAPHYG